MDDGRMDHRAYSYYHRVFMLFGSLVKGFAPGVPLEEWQKHADAFLSWSRKRARELVDEAYNGGPPLAGDPEAPEEKKEEGPVINAGQAKRFYAVAYNEGGYTKEGVERLLKKHGFKSAYKIPVKQYNAMCSLAQSKSTAAEFNKEGV